LRDGLKLPKIGLSCPLRWVALPQNAGEIPAHHEQRRERLASSVESLLTVMDCFFDVAVAGGNDAEGDAGFG
jgi:hypothetical protein